MKVLFDFLARFRLSTYFFLLSLAVLLLGLPATQGALVDLCLMLEVGCEQDAQFHVWSLSLSAFLFAVVIRFRGQ